MGKLIVIEGLDGSGKGTQAELLCKKLSQQHKTRKISFPNYQSPSSSLVKMYLAGEFGGSAKDVNAYAASTFYAVDRYATWKTDLEADYNSGTLLIADRYVTSNAIHQCAKLPKNEWKDYIYWMEDFEYDKIKIPRPNTIIYLDVEPEVSQRLLSSRYGNDEGKKDIHERDIEYLKNCRRAALWCAENLGWKHVFCSSNVGMRSIEDISEEIYSYIMEVL